MAILAPHGGLPRRHLARPAVNPTAAAGGAAGAVFALLTLDAVAREPGRLEIWGIRTVQRIDESPGRWRAIEFVDGLTSSTVAVAAWGMTVLLLAGLRWWLPAALALTLPIGGVVNEVVSRLVGRSRPHLSEVIRDSINFEERSFPSGHVQGAVLLYGLLYVVAGRIRWRPVRWLARAVCLTVIVAVGFARLWKGAHWPSDVVAGYALGLAMLTVLVWSYRRLEGSDAAVWSWVAGRITTAPR